MLVEFLGLLAAACALVYYWATQHYNYWQNQGVKVPHKATPFLGHLKEPFLAKVTISAHFENMYNSFKGERFLGYYKLRQPALLVRDPELIKHVMLKDFNSFHDNDLFINESRDPLLAYHILATHGARWRFVRSKLSPAFSSGKIKGMFPLVVEICKDMKGYIDRALQRGDKTVEAKQMAANYKTDVAALCAFGVKSNALSDKDSIFKQQNLSLLSSGGVLRSLSLMITYFSPTLKHLFNLKFVDDKLAVFFRKLVTDTMQHRERNNIVRNDFIQILMQLKQKGSIEYEAGDFEDADTTSASEHEKERIEWTENMLTAQTLGFIGDSFETLSTGLSFAIYEISLHPDIQERCKNEIESVLAKYDNKVCYDALVDMTYLDQVVSESLRKYPPIGILNRLCTKNYTIPGTNVKFEAGTAVSIPVQGLHHDPKYWPNPDKFDPERFNEQNIHKIVPYTYLPFGGGPRMCLGNRFGKLQVKAAIATVIRFYELQPSPLTKYPVRLEPHFGTHPVDGLHVKFVPRK